jgi:hypothetical protein
MKSNVHHFLLGKYAVRRAKKAPPPNSSPSLRTAGRREINNLTDEENKDLAKLKNIVNESKNILVQAKAVFPFNLFPDIITLDHHKLTIVYKKFFGIQESISVPIENIKNVQANCSPLFGSLTITSDHFVNNTQEVNYLWKKDAQEIQRMVQGAIVAHTEGIDLTKIDAKDLKKLLNDLGKGEASEKPSKN